MTLSKFSMPLKYATAEVCIQPDGTDRSEVTFKMEYEPKFGPLGWLMNHMMMRRMMKKMFKQVLAGLEYHILTGKAVGKNGADAFQVHTAA